MLTLSVVEYIIELHNANSPVKYRIGGFFRFMESYGYQCINFDGTTMYYLAHLREFLKSEFYHEIT